MHVRYVASNNTVNWRLVVWCTQNVRRDGSSFTCPPEKQPKQRCHFGGCLKRKKEKRRKEKKGKKIFKKKKRRKKKEKKEEEMLCKLQSLIWCRMQLECIKAYKYSAVSLLG